MTIKQRMSDRSQPVTIRQALRELDDYEAESERHQQYDVDLGLSKLRTAIAAEHATEGDQTTQASEPTVDQHTPAPTWSSAATRRMIFTQCADALSINFLIITSTNSREFAARLGPMTGPERWAVSWWAGRSLTRQQAISAMVLTDLLFKYELDRASMLLVMRDLATDLGASPIAILNRLSVARNQIDQTIDPADPHWWPSPRTLDMWREDDLYYPPEEPGGPVPELTEKKLREAN